MIFKHHLPSSRTIIMIYRKASKGSRNPMWMKKEVLKMCNIKRNHKRGGWKDRLSWRNVRGLGGVGKAEAQVELVRDVIKRLEKRWICC